MNFKLKQTLIGIAAISMFAPLASHAQTTKGQWIFDGFGRAAKDGNGSRCVSSGGSDHAFASEECDQSSGAMAAKSSSDAAMTQTKSETPMETPTAAAPAVAEPAAAAVAAPAAPAAAATMTAASEPVSGIASDTSRNGIVRDANGVIVRDGVNRYCVWDSRWSLAVSGENCEANPKTAMAAAEPETPAVAQPEQELAPRIAMPDPEIDPASLGAASAAAPKEPVAAVEDKPSEVAAVDNLTDRSPGQAPPPAAQSNEPAAIVDNNAPEFPVTKYELDKSDSPSTETTALADTSPGVAPPAEQKKEDQPVVDNEPAKFPENKYTVEDAPAIPPKKEPEQVAAAAPAKTVLANFQMEKAKLFAFNSAKLRRSALGQIDALVDTLNTATGYGTVNVVGHTDKIGSERYNQRLSERRAAAVRAYLVSKGVSADKIAAIGRGKAEPVTASGDCDGLKGKKLRSCLAPDRRVVVEAAGTLPSQNN